ncbi:hypothetical protein M0802_012629 [Mischocyttarus mexicanus]|nr:hypothetical protein M0802_012629 [Mischocyttarus mexicanus]
MVCTYSLMSIVYWVVLLGWKGWVAEQSIGETKSQDKTQDEHKILPKKLSFIITLYIGGKSIMVAGECERE